MVEGSWKGRVKNDDGTVGTKEYHSTHLNIQWQIMVHEDQKCQTSVEDEEVELMILAEELMGGLSISK